MQCGPTITREQSHAQRRHSATLSEPQVRWEEASYKRGSNSVLDQASRKPNLTSAFSPQLDY